MSDTRLDHALRAAIAEGLLPPGATVLAHDDRPWPVVLLTAFGAWLAAIPLIGLSGLLLYDTMRHGPGQYIVGVLALAAAIYALRRSTLPLFVEQLITPLLIVGMALLGWGLFRDLPEAVASAMLALVALGSGFAIPRPWLRVVLAATAAALAALAWLPWDRGSWHDALFRFWLAWHLNLLVWAAAGAAQRSLLGERWSPRLSAAVESMRAGWLLATLAGLAWWSGMTFLVGASVAPGGLAGELFGRLAERDGGGTAMAAMRVVSLLLAVGAAAWAARRWRSLRTPAAAGVALVLVVLAWFMPALGATLVALSACAVGKRWRLAATAGLTAAWIVGGFYYQLAWPLATKAGVLVIAGIVLGALAWLAFRGDGAAATSASGEGVDSMKLSFGAAGLRSVPIDRLGIIATALLVVLAANVAIWQKEDLIANGQPVFVAIAPADPRSLMQGDYMRLNFRIPPALLEGAGGLLDNERPVMVATKDERGVVSFVRLHHGEPLAAGELRIELTPMHGDWVVVSDAWSFAEGEAARWAPAKFGEFRVDAKGHALLVGLRGEKLEKL
jgi:uncharacterized membrane-anchored protein